MPQRKEPIERARAKARGDGRTPGKREIQPVQFEIIKREDAPPMPRGLGTRGRSEWCKIWDAGPWLNPSQDYPWVEQIARAYDEITAYRKTIEKDGLVQKGSMGQPIAHPLIAEVRKCEATIRQCLSIIGYSPTDRARLGLAEIKRQTALEDLIAKGRPAP